MIPANLDRDEFYKVFIDRTRDNVLNYNGDFEITNLVNALLGLIVLPKETLLGKFNFISDDIKKKLFESIEEHNINDEEQQTTNIADIIRYIRNAICHGGIQYRGEYNPYNELIVNSIEFTNDYEDDNHNCVYFKINIDISILQCLIEEIYSKVENI